MPKVKKKSEASILMLDQLKEIDTVPCQIAREWPLMDGRRWRLDFAILPASWGRRFHKIGIEIEGGVWTQGRHTRGKGFIADMEKYNYAALMGWKVLRFTPQQVLKGEAIAFIKRVLDSC
jgi:hypothetical protein